MSDHREPNLAERLERLRDPNGPTFVSPLGDRRERPIPCSRCRRPTPALRAVCVSCLEAELLEGAVDPCEGISDEALDAAEAAARWSVNPDSIGAGWPEEYVEDEWVSR